MIIQTPMKLHDVVTIKLVGGDEVLGRLQDEHTENYVEVSKPMMVMMAQQGFGLVPYVLTAGPDARIQINAAHVIAVVKTIDPVAKEYMKQTSSLLT